MRISVIGTVMSDVIHTVDGQTIESFGGILYNVLAVAAVTRGTDQVVPFCNLSPEHRAMLVETFFSRIPQLDPTFFRGDPSGTDQNTLRYRTASERDEQMTIRTSPLDGEALRAAGKADAVLFNCINGRELSLESLRRLRDSFEGLLHIDVHNLGKRLDESGRLCSAPFADWREWLSLADIIQLNEWEAERIFGLRPDSEAAYERVVLELLKLPRARIAALTLGSLGSIVAHRDRKGQPAIVRLNAIPYPEIRDTTGCGDSFSAGLLVGYLRWRSVPPAAVLATTLSSMKSQIPGLAGLTRITDVPGCERQYFGSILERVADGWEGDPPGQSRA